MRINVLGPLEVLDPPIAVSRPADRAVMTILAASSGEIVSIDRLVDGLWGERAPDSASRTLRTYVHHLRSLMPEGVIATAGAGYRLDLEPGCVDASQFITGLESAGDLVAQDPSEGARLLRAALGLWRGPPFADAPNADHLIPLRTRLESLHLQARVDLLGARLAMGEDQELVPELRALLEEQPLLEDAWALLMTALYRTGRQADSLRAYASARRHLVEELGIDPGPDLRHLEARILAQDPGLLLTPPPMVSPTQTEADRFLSESQRRLATFVLAEMTAERTGGEGASEPLNVVREVLERLGGSIVATNASSVIASFGIPVARDDDAYRAIRGAIEARSDAALAARAGDAPADIHLAVLSLPVDVTAGQVSQLTGVTGRLIDLLSAADPGDVVVDDATRRRLDRLFTWEEESGVTPDGVPVWRVGSTRGTADKVRMSPRLRARLVGRETELAAARTVIDAGKKGLGGLLIVRGEAGVGKTRLVEELRTFASEQMTWLVGHCAAYAEAIPYWPIASLLRDWLDLGVDDTDVKARVALQAKLESTLDSPERVFPYLAGVLGGTQDGSSGTRTNLAPEALQYRTFEALGELVEALARRAPLVAIIEDVHWADPTSLRLIEQLLEYTERTALVIVLTMRPDPDHTSQQLLEVVHRTIPHRVTEIHVDALLQPAQAEMLDSMVGAGTLPEKTVGQLLQLAEGNPFYVEELVGTLVDAGALVRAGTVWRFDHDLPLTVPESVEKIVQSRIDRLDPRTREVVTSAAVLGRSFGLPLLQGVTEEPAGLLTSINQLLRLDLLIEARRWPQAEYVFKHALTQEAAYRTLSEERRRDLHRRAAVWLEHRHEANLNEVAGLLANHCLAAGDESKATVALLRAGDVARSEHALDEAIGHYRAALPILERNPDRRETAVLLLKLANAFHSSLRFAEANDAYQQAFELWDYGDVAEATETLRVSGPPFYRPADPVRSYALQDIQLQMALFDRLVERWPDDTLVPSLADRWTISADGLEYVFHLRPGLSWSDGTPLTAHDAAFGILRNLDPLRPGMSVAMLYVIAGARDHVLGVASDPDSVGVEVLDDLTIRFRLDAPAPYFLSMLNRPDCGPQPRHAIEKLGDEWATADNEVVSGPFHRVDHDADHVTLERRPGYPGTRFGNVHRVEWRQGTYEAAIANYAEGRGDLLWLGAGWRGEGVDRVPPSDIYPEPPAGLTYLYFDFEHERVGNPAVRRGLAHAIDRTALADVFPVNSMVATGGVVPPPLAGHTPDIALRFDPELARALVKPHEWIDPLRVVTTPLFTPRVVAVAEMWRAHLGIAVDVTTLEGTRLREYPGERHEYAVYPAYWYPGYTDPEYFLRLLLTHDAMDNAGSFNHPPFDALVARAIAERDEHTRLELFHAADRMAVAEAVALIPLAYVWNTSVRAPYLHGWWEFGKSWASFADVTIERR